MIQKLIVNSDLFLAIAWSFIRVYIIQAIFEFQRGQIIMRYFFGICAVMVFLGFGYFGQNISGQEKPSSKFLAVLSKGQAVNLSRADGKYTLDLVDGNMFSKVIEIGSDYIAIEGVAPKMEIRIPVTSILEIRKLKEKQE